MKRQFAAVNLLPDTADESPSGQYQTCLKAVNLLKRSQPAMLQRWTPLATEGDGNCLFRAVSQAVFGSQEYHSQLRLLACLEVGSHAATYDRDAPTAHKLLKQDTLVAPTFDELWKDLCTAGRSCCFVALLALSAVLQVRIWSFFPPLQSAFVSPLTLEIVGRDVPADSNSVAVMWSTSADANTTDVDINHLVTLRRSPYEEQHQASQAAPSSHVPPPVSVASGSFEYICIYTLIFWKLIC